MQEHELNVTLERFREIFAVYVESAKSTEQTRRAEEDFWYGEMDDNGEFWICHHPSRMRSLPLNLDDYEIKLVGTIHCNKTKTKLSCSYRYRFWWITSVFAFIFLCLGMGVVQGYEYITDVTGRELGNLIGVILAFVLALLPTSLLIIHPERRMLKRKFEQILHACSHN